MTHIFDGKKLANEIAAGLQQKVKQLRAQGITPKLAIVASAPDDRVQAYIRMKQRRAESIGMEIEYHDMYSGGQQATRDLVHALSERSDVHGIICQLPLSGWYDPQELIDCIVPSKDVDGLTSASQEALEQGKPGFVPATPLGVLEILSYAKVDLPKAQVCVIGRSNLVGRPLSLLLKHRGAQVVTAHKHTPDIPALARQADIIISAAGSPKLVTADMVRDGATVIDVGINELDGKLRGDVDFDAVAPKASFITPVPGGVGPLTVVMLLKNVVQAAQNAKESN